MKHNMNDQDRLNELRHVLYNEIKSELSYEEKKEFARKYCDESVIARLLEKNRKKKRNFSIFVILYALFIMFLLIFFLVRSDALLAIMLVSLALALLPVLVVNIFANRTFLGYQKLDLVLRIITKFYVRK